MSAGLRTSCRFRDRPGWSVANAATPSVLARDREAVTGEKAAKPASATGRPGTDAPHTGAAGADRSPGTCHRPRATSNRGPAEPHSSQHDCAPVQPADRG